MPEATQPPGAVPPSNREVGNLDEEARSARAEAVLGWARDRGRDGCHRPGLYRWVLAPPRALGVRPTDNTQAGRPRKDRKMATINTQWQSDYWYWGGLPAYDADDIELEATCPVCGSPHTVAVCGPTGA